MKVNEKLSFSKPTFKSATFGVKMFQNRDNIR